MPRAVNVRVVALLCLVLNVRRADGDSALKRGRKKWGSAARKKAGEEYTNTVRPKMGGEKNKLTARSSGDLSMRSYAVYSAPPFCDKT
jgi:hypothetical protein